MSDTSIGPADAGTPQKPTHVENMVDESIEESFPASDAPAVTPADPAPGKEVEGGSLPDALNPDLPVPPGKGPSQPIGTPRDREAP